MVRREDFFFTYDYGSGVNVAMADGSVHYPADSAIFRPRTCGRCCKSAAAKKNEPVLTRIDDDERRLNWPNIAALAVWLLSVGTLLTRAVRSRKVLSVLPSS